MKNIILDILKQYGGDSRKMINSILRSSSYIFLREEIFTETSFLKYDAKIAERIFCILNDITTQVVCKNCSNGLKFKRGVYRIFCSSKCVGIFNKEKIGKSNRENYLLRGAEINQKRKETFRLKYNVDNAMQLSFIREKAKKTLKDRTGHEFALQNIESKNKYRETCMIKFSVDNPSKSDLIKNKKKEKCLLNYGVTNWFKTIESRDRLNNSLKEKYKVYNASQLGKGSYSKVSQNLFWKIYNLLPNDLRKKTYFAELNREFVITSNNESHYFYDFVISNIKFCIEFNGDRWHANPNMFESNDRPLTFIDKTAREIWTRDAIKLNALRQRGFEIQIVWESDLKLDLTDKYVQMIIDIIISKNDKINSC